MLVAQCHEPVLQRFAILALWADFLNINGFKADLRGRRTRLERKISAYRIGCRNLPAEAT